MHRFGFIGVGHMGKTLAEAVIRAEGAENVVLCDADAVRVGPFAQQTGCTVMNAGELAADCRYIYLGVKPQNMRELLETIGPVLARRQDFSLVTMAAGITTKAICGMLGFEAPVLRIMPNTPAAVGEGCMLYAGNGKLADEGKNAILDSLRLTGQLCGLPEELIDAGCAISGCGPAFVYQFIIAFAKAGESVGLAPDIAARLAGQTVLGAARLAVESGEAPEVLCSQVCSPGGSTIEGVRSLEAGEFAGEVEKAVRASYERTVELGREK